MCGAGHGHTGSAAGLCGHSKVHLALVCVILLLHLGLNTHIGSLASDVDVHLNFGDGQLHWEDGSAPVVEGIESRVVVQVNMQVTLTARHCE